VIASWPIVEPQLLARNAGKSLVSFQAARATRFMTVIGWEADAQSIALGPIKYASANNAMTNPRSICILVLEIGDCGKASLHVEQNVNGPQVGRLRKVSFRLDQGNSCPAGSRIARVVCR
jgi:hypothetical protein